MSLAFDHVSYLYPGTTHGVHDLSFEVPQGELVAVIGPSGSGKSTLLKLVCGLAEGHDGRIALEGQDLAGVPIHQRRVGMVFQSYALFPHLNVADNVAYGLRLRGVDAPARRRRAGELLELVGLAEHAQRHVQQLSGGQQQRVALARALAIEPRALLLDEPLSALDAGIRGHLRDEIRQLQRRFGTTTLLVTHDQEEALTMADHVAVLQAGRLVQMAPPRTLYHEPASTAVAGFVGLSTIWPGTVVGRDRLDMGFALLSAPTHGRAAGTRVQLLVRPEHVLADPPPGTPNRLEGHSGLQRFLGASTRYDFHIAGAPRPLLAESPTVARQSVCLPPERLRVLDH